MSEHGNLLAGKGTFDAIWVMAKIVVFLVLSCVHGLEELSWKGCLRKVAGMETPKVLLYGNQLRCFPSIGNSQTSVTTGMLSASVLCMESSIVGVVRYVLDYVKQAR